MSLTINLIMFIAHISTDALQYYDRCVGAAMRARSIATYVGANEPFVLLNWYEGLTDCLLQFYKLKAYSKIVFSTSWYISKKSQLIENNSFIQLFFFKFCL